MRSLHTPLVGVDSRSSRVLETLDARQGAPVLWEVKGALRAQDLLQRIGQISDALASEPGRCVGVLVDNGADWVASDLAVLAADRICVPVPRFFSPEQLRHVAQAAGIQTWLIDAPEPPLPADGKSWTFKGLGDGLWRWTRADERASTLPPPHTAKITFTSGTTGQPKGVCLSQPTLESVAGSLAELARELGLQRHLCALPLSLLLENVAGVYAPLLAGIPTVVLPLAQLGWQGSSSIALPKLLGEIERWQPDSLILVPELLHGLVTALEWTGVRPRSLRFVAVGGGRVSEHLLDRAAAVGLPIYEGYGLSECASVVTLNRPRRERRGTVGQPLPHARIDMADDGEVIVHGPCMEGYLGDAPHPTPGRWATGDVGRMDGDFLRLTGRKRNVFITSLGRNVSPEWVEAELAQTLPIAQAAVFGEARPRNVAVLVPRAQGVPSSELSPTIEAAVRHANQRLPDYAQVSAWILADEPFSAENGLATQNGRNRRDAIEARYRRQLEATEVRMPGGDPTCPSTID
jgi:long-chain acyl-CoA synthetase